MSPDGIEIAQHDALDRCTAVDVVGDDLLVDFLRVAVGRRGLLVGCLLGDGQIFGQRLPIDRATRREDEALHVVAGHEFQQIDERHHVVAIIEQGLLHALAHRLAGGEVDDARDGRIFLEHGFGGGKVAQVHLLECRTDARDLFDAVEHLHLGVAQVVYNDHIVACLLEFDRGVAAYKARSAGH